jgi:hypothetical protein
MNHDDDVDYAAISYVWGDVDQYSMNAGIYSDPSQPPLRSLSSVLLPRIITDAMQVVLLLELRYLWMDSVCIDQWNAEERNSVISRMNVIYHNASLTIIAAAGDSADAGLSGISTNLRRREIPIEMKSIVIVTDVDIVLLLLHRVGPFYERIEVGTVMYDQFQSLGKQLSSFGFQLGWFTIR